MICVLAGGVGAARFLRGLVQVVPAHDITAIVNTGDDTVLHGLSISPDLDTVTYTPANAVTNFVSQGSIFYFWCTTAAFWNVQLFAKANPASTGLTGACAFGS